MRCSRSLMLSKPASAVRSRAFQPSEGHADLPEPILQWIFKGHCFIMCVKGALFLGAGASVIAGLPTTEMLMTDLKIKHQHNPDYPFLAGYGKFDVERLDAEIETFLDYKDTTILNYEISAQSEKMTLNKFKENLKQLRVDIRDLLFEKLVLTRDKLNLFQQAFEPLLQPPIDIQYVFTTNYDMLVEEACSNMGIGVIDGFRKRENDLRASWSNYWEPKKDVIQLLKLHGSLNWWRDQKNGNVFKESTVSMHTHDNDILERPTLVRKSYDDPVLRQLFERFKKALRDVDFIIAIGTSFRDEIIVGQIHKHLRNNAMLYVLSPDAKRDTSRAFGKFTPPINLTWYEHKFGPENPPYAMDSILNALDLHERSLHN